MLIQFSVENFMSIKNKAVLNLSASETDNEHPGNYAEINKARCLRTALIYGANASGKSCLMKALASAILMIRSSQAMQVGQPISLITPFMLDKVSPTKPTAFEFIFFSNGVRYLYGFSATKEKIVDEYLYVYGSAKKSMVFERINTINYEYTKANTVEFKAYEEKNTANKLLLATATAWNCKKTYDPYMWFATGIDIVTPDADINKLYAFNVLPQIDSPEIREFILRLLKNADISIENYGYQPNSKILITEHTNPNNERYSLLFNNESLGTQNLFVLSPLLYDALKNGKTLMIDEMSSLHTLLVQYIVSLFNDPTVNVNNAQLVFVTHDTNLLDLSVFRRDQIYFIEKNDFGESDLFSLDNFSVRKNEKVRVAYLLGRYGAIPNIEKGESL